MSAPAVTRALEVVRVLTLNLWHDSGPYPARRALVRTWIAELDPDVIGFQEALRSPGFDQVAELLDGLNYHVAFAAALPNSVTSRVPGACFGSRQNGDAAANAT